jgi:predicted Zn-dependent protease
VKQSRNKANRRLLPACGHNFAANAAGEALTACIGQAKAARTPVIVTAVELLRGIELPELLKIALVAGDFFRRKARISTFVLMTASAAILSSCQMPGTGGESLGPSANPVTLETIKPDKYATLAQEQHPKILATFGGEYSNPKLERMVAKIVGQLVLTSDDPSQAYRVTILNSPSVNAFALPGGYMYVTRGMLALANDSAEVAAVLSHEMAHVTARHGILRQRKEQEEAVAQEVVSNLLRDDAEARAEIIRGKLRLAQFSRNQELQADAIGVAHMARAGYDAFAAVRFLKSMESFADFRSVSDPGNTDLDFLATHPATPKRIELVTQLARKIGPPGTGRQDREAFLDGIDGMLFGDSPEEGYVRGHDFLHPRLGIAFSVPQGFVINNSASEVTAAGPENTAIRFDAVALSRSTSLRTYLESGWVAGLDESSIQETRINGLQAVTALASAEQWDFDITLIRQGGQVYRLLTAAPKGSGQVIGIARSVSGSFRIMSQTERASLNPLHIRIADVSAGENVGSMAARMRGTDRPLELFRILNGLGKTSSISAGDKVKIVTN